MMGQTDPLFASSYTMRTVPVNLKLSRCKFQTQRQSHPQFHCRVSRAELEDSPRMTDFTPGALIRVQRIGLLRASTVHTQASWTECLGGGGCRVAANDRTRRFTDRKQAGEAGKDYVQLRRSQQPLAQSAFISRQNLHSKAMLCV